MYLRLTEGSDWNFVSTLTEIQPRKQPAYTVLPAVPKKWLTTGDDKGGKKTDWSVWTCEDAA